MGIWYAVGNALVSRDEMVEKVALGDMERFRTALASKPAEAKLDFTFGRASAENFLTAFSDDEGKLIGFEEIGPGKPLTVAIRHVYVGDEPRDGIIFDKNDVLVTSAMKSIAAYKGQPRAVNFVRRNMAKGDSIRTVHATEEGTPLICYTPALTVKSSVVTVEVAFDEFDEELFETLQSAFSEAAGIPLFAPASGYLIGAGIVSRLIGRMGNAIFDSEAEFKQTEEITFVFPGSARAVARFALLLRDDAPQLILKDYEVGPEGKLVRIDDPKKAYDGPEPYVVLVIDGRQSDEYKDFTPTAASAALLQRFYNVREGSAKPMGALLDAVKLASDMSFRCKAERLAERMKEADPGSDQYKALAAEREACIKNIVMEDLKPKD